MRSKIFGAVAVVCLAAASAAAQDPAKVEPKHYKLDFENDRVQVMSVHYGPHEKSGLHDHPGGVVVSLTPGHLRFTDETGKTREAFAKPGEVRWYAPFKHRVENLADTAYDAVYIGVKGKLAAAADSNEPTTAMDDDQARKVLAEYLASLKPQP